jgi:hypothetical protein
MAFWKFYLQRSHPGNRGLWKGNGTIERDASHSFLGRRKHWKQGRWAFKSAVAYTGIIVARMDGHGNHMDIDGINRKTRHLVCGPYIQCICP